MPDETKRVLTPEAQAALNGTGTHGTDTSTFKPQVLAPMIREHQQDRIERKLDALLRHLGIGVQ